MKKERVTREKFFDIPIYAQAIRDLTPTKPEKEEEKENPKKIHKELLKNNEEGKKDPKTTETKKETIKPKMIQTIFQTPARNRMGSLSKQEKLMNYLSPRSQAKSLFAQSMEQHILPPDLESFGALNDKESGLHGPASRVRRSNPITTQGILSNLQIKGYRIILPKTWQYHNQARIILFAKDD